MTEYNEIKDEDFGKEFVVIRDNKADYVFTGVLISQSSAKEDDGREKNFTIYRTINNNYICVKTESISNNDVVTVLKSEAEDMEDIKQIIEYFGYCKLAKLLYQVSKIDAKKRIF